ncbi:Multidrug resistance-associated protein 1 [Haplosporangium bisporale]|nr:Multidrug resistance-associated protein 1 [Haplosporangium bisporale]
MAIPSNVPQWLCRDNSEGWGPLSPDRIDFTLCFEYSIFYALIALLSLVVFLIRIYHLRTACMPHRFGRTAWIYWPTQIFISLAALTMFALGVDAFLNERLLSIQVLASIAMASTLLCGLFLNKEEHKYKIRSSNSLFVFLVLSILASTFILHTLYDLHRTASFEFYFNAAFIAFILAGFTAEAWPRGSTQVQQRANDVQTYDKANLMSQLTFYFFQPIVSLAARQQMLIPSDITSQMPEEYKTASGYSQLSESWSKRVNAYLRSTLTNPAAKKPSLFATILIAYRRPLIPIVLIHIALPFMQYLSPVLLGLLLDYVEASSEENSKPLSYGVALAVAMFVTALILSLMNAFKMKTVLLALKLSPDARRVSSTGHITNHVAVDADLWEDAIPNLSAWISIPFDLAICLTLLYHLLGWSFTAGLLTFVALIPVQAWRATVFEGLEEDRMKATDERVRITSEVLASIKIVKLYGWEEAFKQRILKTKHKELDILYRSGIVEAAISLVFASSSILCSLVTFATYVTIGHGVLTPKTVFVSIALFDMLHEPIARLAEGTTDTISIVVATKRIQRFLLREDIDDTQVARTERSDSNQPAIEIKDGVFSWTSGNPAQEDDGDENDDDDESDENQPLLSQSDCNAESPGTLQEPVTPALRNINLSLMPRTLTAVVGRVGQGKSSLLNAIIGEMYKLEGTITVRDRIAYVPQQAWIFNATLRDNVLFGRTYDQERYRFVITACGLEPDLAILPGGDMTEIGERGINLSGGQKQRVSLARAAYQDADIYLLDDPLSAVDAHVDQHLWQNLIGPEGLLKNKTRLLVTHGINHLDNVDQIILLKEGQIAEVGKYEDLMVAKEAFYQLIKDYSHKNGAKRHRRSSHVPGDHHPSNNALGAPATDSEAGSVQDSDDNLTVEDSDAPEDDHKKSHLGRILNRFTTDLFSIDEHLPWKFLDLTFLSVNVASHLIIISVTLPAFLFAVPVILVIYYVIQWYFLWATRSLKRIYSVATSPVYQHLDETLNGVATIRAMNMQSQFITENANRVDYSLNAFIAFMYCNRWVEIRLQTLSALITLAVALVAVFGREYLDPSAVGLTLSYAIDLTVTMMWLVRDYSEWQSHLIAIERVQEYTDKKTEAPEFLGVDHLPSQWPAEGRIAFKNYSARYREGLDLVVKNLSFDVQPCEKVGIVGRTGAGKSSLTLSLFRIIEAANSQWAKACDNSGYHDKKLEQGYTLEEEHEDGGSIEIDGIDISTLGLTDLRRHLAIIPQDPTLFAGTVRENLDPFQEQPDTDLWEALERAHLKEYIRSLPGGLSYEVSQNGDNFSVGQRSLICLARALLRKSKILILDEATAAVDVETDELIQRTIREEFRDRTVLTIAHRIKTVMDSDKILVMEQGRVVEYASPRELLDRGDESLFYRLAHQAGEVAM